MRVAFSVPCVFNRITLSTCTPGRAFAIGAATDPALTLAFVWCYSATGHQAPAHHLPVRGSKEIYPAIVSGFFWLIGARCQSLSAAVSAANCGLNTSLAPACTSYALTKRKAC